MELFFDKVFTNCYCIGDIHGEIEKIVFKITQQYKMENSLIILAGDVGIGFHKPNYYLDLFKKLNLKLKKNNNILLMLRGNHDDPKYWNNELFLKYHQENDKSNIRFLKDYTVVNVNDIFDEKKIYCQGGAISIDRKWRIENNAGYWEDEIFVYDEDKIKDLTGITHIITHSAPDFAYPFDKSNIMYWLMEDSNLLHDLNFERDNHTKMYNKLCEKNNIKMYLYGHFHMTKTEYIGNTKFRLCDIGEIVDLNY